jgi:hypothetical protein
LLELPAGALLGERSGARRENQFSRNALTFATDKLAQNSVTAALLLHPSPATQKHGHSYFLAVLSFSDFVSGW